MNKKLVDVVGTAVLFIGMLLAFLPHALHVKAGLEETSHIVHIIIGIFLVLIGLGVLIYNKKH